MGNIHSSFLRACALILVISFIFLSVTGCGAESTSEPTKDPLMELAITQTVLALQQTQAALANDSNQGNTEAATPEPTTPPLLPEPPATEPLTSVEPTEAVTTFEDWMRVANVLASEDIFFHKTLSRYVLETLKNMESEYGLHYTYVGSATNEFKKKLLLEAPPGGWDLIIAANEAKMPPIFKGEFFTYLNNALEDGTPVILELYYLDLVSEGKIEPILERCGIEFQKDWEKVSVQSEMMWPLAPEHPILNIPNSGLEFDETTGTWAHDYDIGDLVKIGSGGDARLLLGVSSTNDKVYGTLTSCIGEHLTLQTFSSHQLDEDTSLDLWENYIYNALRTRYEDIFP